VEDLVTRQQLQEDPVVLVAVVLEGEIYKPVSMLMSIQAGAVEVAVVAVIHQQEVLEVPVS